MQRPVGFLRLTRPLNSAMMGCAVVVGASLVTSLTFSIQILLGFFTAFTLTGASMAINDYCDRTIDAINEPHRPIPSGLVSPTEAFYFSLALAIIGLLFAFGTSLACLLLAALAWMVSVAYATKGKRTGLPGNFLVSLCVVIPFLYGSVVVEKVGLSLVIFTAIVFLSNTGREITKGIVDVQGDQARGIETISVRYGEKNAAIASSLLYILAVGLTPLPWLWGYVSKWFLPFIILTDAGFVASALLLMKNPSRENARRIKNLILLWFIMGLLAFLMGTS